MKERKTTKKGKEVKIGSSNVKERNSRNSFEMRLSPWVCTGTSGADHGHDYHVEIVSTTNIDDFTPEGRFFLVQLKSQSKLIYKDGFIIPHPIETKKIKQWSNASSQVPYLFVVNDIPKQVFYYTWIDEAFLTQLDNQSPLWIQNEKITIRIPESNKIDTETQKSIREYTYNYKYTSRKVLEPGTFFEMQNKVEQSIQLYENLIKSTPFDSVKEDVRILKQDCLNAVYRIAITGLSRVGKSSLINSLLKRPDISPTDIWQTTGVPILINSGREEQIKIHFSDIHAQSIIHPYSAQIIKEFASREFNEDNYKKIRDVTVSISSPQLERGVMFYDIPGLDDPNDNIMDFAYHTADCANVILYLIDGASARTGSFVFKNDYKKHIEKFSRSKDKVFLIVNKVDELSRERLLGLKSEIERNLEKYSLKSMVAPKIYYLSIDPSNTVEHLKDIINSVSELESDLWSYMLTENKVGFFKLYSLMKEIESSSVKLQEILRARSLDANQKNNLLITLSDLKQRIPNLGEFISSQQRKISKAISANMQIRKNRIIENLENSLTQMTEMPTDAAIKDFLIKNGHAAINKSDKDLGIELAGMNDSINKWIEDNLKRRVREVINIDSNNINYTLDEISSIKLPSMDFSSAWSKGFIAGFAAFMINPVVAGVGVLIGLGSAFLDLLFGQEDRKAKRVKKIVENVKKLYQKAFADAEFSLQTKLNDQVTLLIELTNKNLKLYFSDIETQISRYDLHTSFDYVTFEKDSQTKLGEINTVLMKVWDELQLYLSIIRPI